MYVFNCDGIYYYIISGTDTYLDFIGMADECFTYDSEHEAIREQLLMKAGVL